MALPHRTSNDVGKVHVTLHYPTVPIDVARQKVSDNDAEGLRPLVLIVDDEPLIAETLAAILNDAGFATLTAHDGLAALEIAQLMPPQMLITDVVMPRMNGFELAVEVKRTIPDCEIILFSGQESTSDLLTEYNSHGSNFVMLIKPVHPTDLLAHVFDQLSPNGSPVAAGRAPRRSSPHDTFSIGPVPVFSNPGNGCLQS